jgi:hypothetical protein
MPSPEREVDGLGVRDNILQSKVEIFHHWRTRKVPLPTSSPVKGYEEVAAVLYKPVRKTFGSITAQWQQKTFFHQGT